MSVWTLPVDSKGQVYFCALEVEQIDFDKVKEQLKCEKNKIEDCIK